MVDTNNLIPLLGIATMVSSDTGLPDPDNPNGDLRVTNEDVILVTDDEESDDQETIVLDEYQPLPVEEEAMDSNHGYGSSEDEENNELIFNKKHRRQNITQHIWQCFNYNMDTLLDRVDHMCSSLSASGNQLSSNSSSVPQITPMEEVLVKEVWSAPPPKAVDIEMDSKKVDEVKQVMSNIVLPPSSIPEWAASIPEEEWKSQLLKRLQNMQDEKK